MTLLCRIRVANKARMSQGQTRYEVDEEKLLSAKAKVLRKSAILLEQHSEVMAGRADVAKAKRLQVFKSCFQKSDHMRFVPFVKSQRFPFSLASSHLILGCSFHLAYPRKSSYLRKVWTQSVSESNFAKDATLCWI